MFRVFGAIVTLLPLLAMADVDAKFAKVRDQADPIQSLGAFLDKYLGDDCGSVMEGGGDCKKAAEAYRQKANGKKYYMMITEDSSAMLSLGPAAGGGDVTINLTPFFPASNSAITNGAPSHTDAAGNPVIPFMQIRGTLPDGWNPQMMARQLQAGAMRLQVVFTPQGQWAMSKKGGGTMKGVKARIDAVLITIGRTGEQIAVYVNK
jgi:hypothetical protein